MTALLRLRNTRRPTGKPIVYAKIHSEQYAAYPFHWAMHIQAVIYCYADYSSMRISVPV
jgi:hypothetical protein